MRRWQAALFVLVVGVSVVAPGSSARADAEDCGGPADFDGDGRDDLAVGIFGKDPGGKSSAGAIHIVYGSSEGLTVSGDQILHEDVEGMADTAAPGDFFGWAIATGDFNGDGRDDLAAGVPHKQVDIAANGGSVHIVYGSADGLTASGDQVFTENTSGMAGGADDFESFGSSLAACDFDGDGRDDLAVGIPGQTVGTENDAGAAHVIYGSAAGLTASGDQIFHRDVSGVAGEPLEFDFFGNTMTAGDFDGDGRGELVVGCPFCDPGGKASGGEAHVFYGSSAGLTASGDQIWHQDVPNINDTTVQFDRFARGLTTGDFDGDGRDDLAVGVAFKVVNGKDDAGAVHVIYGTSEGLSTRDQVIHQDTADIMDTAAATDFFGKAVSAGDFDGDGRDDLAVGIPGKIVNTKADAGAMHVIYGSGAGLTTSGNQVFHEDSSGMADVSSPQDEFGTSLSTGDYDNDGRDDLTAGVPLKNLPGGKTDAGQVHVVNGSTAGLSASGDLILHEDISGMADEAAFTDFFGETLVGSPFVD